jgi:hypothetical protein
MRTSSVSLGIDPTLVQAIARRPSPLVFVEELFSSSSLYAHICLHERIRQEGGMNDLFIKWKPSQA